MSLTRRPVLAGLALAMLGGGADAGAPGAPYGLIGRTRAKLGKRGELTSALASGTGAMPGCLSYVVAEDVADPDSIWVVELWRDKAAHDASLSLLQVRDAIRRGRPLIEAFEVTAEVRPVAGLPGR